MKLRIHEEEKLDLKGGVLCEYKINISWKILITKQYNIKMWSGIVLVCIILPWKDSMTKAIHKKKITFNLLTLSEA